MLVDLNLIISKFLVSRRVHFVCAFEIDPQLEPKCVFLRGGGNLRVYYSSSGSHPLKITRADLASMAFEVLVIEISLEHIGNSLKASVRVVRESCWKSHFKVIEH